MIFVNKKLYQYDPQQECVNSKRGYPPINYSGRKGILTESYARRIALPVGDLIHRIELDIKRLDDNFNCGTFFDADWVIKAHKACPIWVESFFPVLDYRKISSSYGHAVKEVAEKVFSERKGFMAKNFQKEINAHNLVRRVDTSSSISDVLFPQKNTGKNPDIFVLPAQLGMRHRGRSTDSANFACAQGECLMDSFSALLILLINMGRFSNWQSLSLGCGGDVCIGKDRATHFSPCFSVDDGNSLVFSIKENDQAFGYYGEASFFVPNI